MNIDDYIDLFDIDSKSYSKTYDIIEYVLNDFKKEKNAILECLESRSCKNCKFNSSKNKNDELITCDLHKEFTNQRKIIFCGKWESK